MIDNMLLPKPNDYPQQQIPEKQLKLAIFNQTILIDFFSEIS